jgi:hypothetical protein
MKRLLDSNADDACHAGESSWPRRVHLRMTKKSRARGESFHGERNGWMLMGHGTAAASIDDCALVSEVAGKW